MFIFLLKLSNYSNDLVVQLKCIFYIIIYKLKYIIWGKMHISV